MDTSTPADIQALEDQLDAAERDARSLVAGLSEEQGGWRATPDAWSVAQCLDHIATANRVYLRAMQPAAQQGREQGRPRRGPALPGLIGHWFVRTQEPPVRAFFRMKSPRGIVPHEAPTLADAFAAFVESQKEVRAFLRGNAGLDLAGVRFPNPFIRGLRFSLATGLNILTAHARRHLWQGWRFRQAAECTVGRQDEPKSATLSLSR
jgi:hypothetical protein